MRFIACGDSLFSSRNLANRLDQRIVKLLQEADGAFTNAEFSTPCASTPPAPGRGYMTTVRQSTLDEFVDLNLKLLSFVNNHTGDYGWQGIVETMDAAEERKLIPCGLGRSLREARLPKFLDTVNGRISIVATSSTRSEVFLASDAGAGVVARPGSNPLRWYRSYVLPEKEYNQLLEINKLLGTYDSAMEGIRVETWAPWAEGTFKFGSMYEQNLQIERGEKAYVRTYMNEDDEREILKSIQDAKKRSDLTIFSLHTHEGKNENWYADEVPEFIEKIAHEAIDAGADAVVGHGAHFMRGVEIYKGKPIFYNLGSLLMEFEAGESVIAPEMYESYGYSVDSRPSDLHSNRAKDKNGNFIGFNAERRFSENLMVQMDLKDGKLECTMIPLDLGMDRERVLDRGLPEMASPETGRHITEELERRSQKYQTKFVYDEETGFIKFA